MIIELFGPPTVGKTTWANALAARLREKGLEVELALSYRPSEVSSDTRVQSAVRRQVGDVARRLARPVREMLANADDLAGRSPEALIATTLMTLLPPRSPLWSVRMRQYIWRRAHVWHDSQRAERIVIFDQAFIQAIYSLAVTGAPVDQALIAQALDAVPMPDLLIRLQAPPETIEARLVNRLRRQGLIERLLEIDLRTNMATLGIIDLLDELLRERGQAVVCVNSAGPKSSDDVMHQLEREVMARLAPIGAAA
jgi:thymidylate kinase